MWALGKPLVPLRAIRERRADAIETPAGHSMCSRASSIVRLSTPALSKIADR